MGKRRRKPLSSKAAWAISLGALLGLVWFVSFVSLSGGPAPGVSIRQGELQVIYLQPGTKPVWSSPWGVVVRGPVSRTCFVFVAVESGPGWIGLSMPLWLPALVLMYVGIRWHGTTESALPMRACQTCGYELAGCTVDADGVRRCPECGSLDNTAIGVSSP